MSVGMLPPQPPSTDAQQPGYPGNRPADWRKSFVIWVGALAVLWFILQFLADTGNADIARGLAGLLVFGALFKLGPTAIANAQKLASGGT